MPQRYRVEQIGAGALNEWVTVQQLPQAETRDSTGAVVESWSDTFGFFACVQLLGSTEFPVAEKRFSETTARFITHYRTDIHTPSRQRFKWDGKTWNIQQPRHDERRTQITIEASEIV